MRRGHQVCGFALAMTILMLVLGCRDDGKAELPGKQVAPPKGGPVKMKMPEMKQADKPR